MKNIRSHIAGPVKGAMPTLAGLITLALIPALHAASDLRVNSAGHYLENISDSAPFLLLSDTEWMLNAYTDTQVQEILDDRAAKGFTAIQVFATHSFQVGGGATSQKTDSAGKLPFVSNDPQTLNADYWTHLRWICDEAAARGLHFILVMGEPGRFCDTGVPWRFPDNSSTSHSGAYQYARQVAGYFATAPNVIFAQGQDSQADGRTLPGYAAGCFDADGWRAMAEGTADGVNGVNSKDGSADYSTTLMTYHGCEWAAAYYSDISASFQSDSWIDFYGPEVFHDNAKVYEIVNRDYDLSAPVKPSFTMEGSYEREALGSTGIVQSSYLRIEAWHSFLAGVCGYSYGHCLNWQQSASTAHLNAAGARQMALLKSFASQYDWQNWVPEDLLITASPGSGATWRAGVKSSNGTECVIYFPTNSASTIKNLLASTKTATWMNPRNGVTTSAGSSFTAGESRSMTPPSGWEDAVLVLGTAPVMPQELLANGSFEESGGWSFSAGGPPYDDMLDSEGAVSGTKSLVLSGGNVVGSAVLSQTVTTVAGTSYTLRFEYGAYGSSGKTQQLRADALNGSTVLNGTTVTATGSNSFNAASTTFAPRSFTFTAASTSTIIRFTDQTTLSNSNSCDGILDDVLLTANPAPVSAPTFDIPAGGYGSPISVSLSSATSGASIRYTMDGNDPTGSSSLYSGSPVSITTSTILKARAFVGTTPSSVSTAVYTIQLASGSGAIANGSFEASPGTTGWTFSGAAYEFTNTEGIPSGGGSYSMALSSGNLAGDTVFSQTVATLPGASYELRFQYGAFGASGKTQQLLAEALNGSTVLNSTTKTATGPGNFNPANTTFALRTLAFTATSTSTVIRFTDQTTLSNSNSCDGVIDSISVVGVLPSPWTSADIGSVGVAGGEATVSGLFVVDGSGADISGTADSFRYIQQTATGDCEIKLRVGTVESNDAAAKAGVMIRESLNANSACAMIAVTPSSGTLLTTRSSTGASAASTTGTGSAPYWVKLVRSGNNFSGYTSADGTSWTQVGSTASITMSSGVYIGMSVTAHDNATLNTSTFDSLTVTP